MFSVKIKGVYSQTGNFSSAFLLAAVIHILDDMLNMGANVFFRFFFKCIYINRFSKFNIYFSAPYPRKMGFKYIFGVSDTDGYDRGIGFGGNFHLSFIIK